MSGENGAGAERERQPIFTLPLPVSALVGLLLAIHAAQVLFLSEAAQVHLSIWFGFIPLRWVIPEQFSGGALPLLWTSLTHAFLHASWEHVLINSAWLAAFGSPVARRYGGVRFYLVFGVSAIAGALLFALLSSPTIAVLVGASGGIAGLTGVAVRFVFQPVIVVRDPVTGDAIPVGRKLASMGELWRNTRSRTFIIFWVGFNAIVPFVPAFTGGIEAQIAWQAHLGGFFAGVLLAPLLEFRAKGHSVDQS